MGGGPRRPLRPVQVICVLAAVLPTAANSQQFGPIGRAGSRPVPAKTYLVALGERLNANTIVSNSPSTVYLALAHRRVAKNLDAFQPRRAGIDDWRSLTVVL